MMSLMNDKVGIVHQMPYSSDRSKLCNILEKVYFGSVHARNYLLFNFFGWNLVMGMSNLIRKSVLDECGGLIHFGKYIAEDLLIARAIKKRFKSIYVILKSDDY